MRYQFPDIKNYSKPRAILYFIQQKIVELKWVWLTLVVFGTNLYFLNKTTLPVFLTIFYSVLFTGAIVVIIVQAYLFFHEVLFDVLEDLRYWIRSNWHQAKKRAERK